MQTLEYINLLGESLLFGGSPPYILSHIEGTESPTFNRKTSRGAGQRGETTTSLLQDDRKIDITFVLHAMGAHEMYRLHQELCGKLSASKAYNPATGDRAKVVYTNDLGQWWTWVVPNGPPKWNKRIQSINPALKMSFLGDSPYWMSMSEKSGSFGTVGTPWELPFELPIEFGSRQQAAVFEDEGDAPAPVRIRMQGEGEKPSLINETSGAVISLDMALPTGAELDISTDPDDLYVRMTYQGQTMNAYGLLDATTPISDFALLPGSNTIRYEAGGDSSKTDITISWQDRFEGV